MRLETGRWKRNLALHAMLVPGAVFIFLFNYIPLAGIAMSFQKFIPSKGWFGSKWVGLDNFTYMLRLPDIGQVIYNTMLIAVLKILCGLIVPILTALLLNEIRNGLIKKGVQTLIYLPHFLSWVILGGILMDILSMQDGIVNRFLGLFGIESIFFSGLERLVSIFKGIVLGSVKG